MADPTEKTSLRFRVFLLFAVIAIAVPGLLGGGLWLASNRLDAGAVPPLVLFGGGAGFALIGVVVWAWTRFDTGMVAAIQGLARDLQTLTHSNPDHEIQADPARHLGDLVPAAREAATALRGARNEVAAAIAQATRTADEQKGKLEVILRDLHEGVLICNLDHHILLYNQRALQILHLSGALGLGRPLFSVMNRQPFLHALEQLFNRLADDENGAERHDLTELVVCATVDGRYILEGRVRVEPTDGEPVEFGPGDLVTFPRGMDCVWTISEPVRKHYRFG